MTPAIFHYFPGLENGLPKFHNFPWPAGTVNIVCKKWNYHWRNEAAALYWRNNLSYDSYVEAYISLHTAI